MTETTNRFRQQVYGAYVSAHLRDEVDFSPATYEATTVFLRRRYQQWLPKDKGAAILDLGCGSGKVLFWLRREGFANLSGIDISPEQVDRARLIHPGVQLGDFFSFLEGSRDRYDLVFALDVIEHFRTEEALRLAAAVHGALRPGGRFVVQTVNGSSPFSGHQRNHDLTHEAAYTAHSIETLFRLAGFKRVDVAALGPVVHGPVSALRWLLWRLIVLGLVSYQLIEMGTTGGGVFTQCFAACAHK